MEIDAFLFHRGTFLTSGTVLHVAHDTVPPKILEYFADTLPIFALEFFVIILGIFQWRRLMRGEIGRIVYRQRGSFCGCIKCGIGIAIRCGAYLTILVFGRSI